MKILAKFALSLVLLGSVTGSFAQGNAFSYQGKLTDGCCPATGFYDMTFKVFDNPNPGVSGQVGSSVTTNRAPVSNGLFNVSLDFGSSTFNGARRWLQMDVRTNDAQLTPVTLLPRTELRPTPYAIFAGNSASLNGLNSAAFAPASGSAAYVAKPGDTMTGKLNLPANGLAVGGSQLVVSNGNVGIGTLSPQSSLHVVGGIRARGGPPGAFGANNNGYAFTGSGDDDSGMFSSADGQLEFYLNASEAMRLVNGNVGVGTTAPSERLHVGGNLRYDGQVSKLDVAENTSATVRAADFQLGHSARRGSPGRALVDGASALYLNFAADWPDTVLGGKVGIGTSAPTAPLDVEAPYSLGRFISSSSINGSVLELWNRSASSAYLGVINFINNADSIRGYIGYATGDDLIFATAGAERLRITSAGTVRATRFEGDGSGLTGISAGWGLSGNSGTTPGTQFLGTTDNQPLELRVNNTRVLRLEPTSDSPNVIAGFSGNSVSAGVFGATISGGGIIDGINRVDANFGTVAGGSLNAISGFAATIAGGYRNVSSGFAAIVGGGGYNTNSGYFGTVSGGLENGSSANFGTVGGGQDNLASASSTTVGGGSFNTAAADFATVGGGLQNQGSGSFATVSGGVQNHSRAEGATAGGGQSNFADHVYTTIAGGQNNRAKGPYCTIGGGSNNFCGETFFVRRGATVSGGFDNAATGNFATVGGGSLNASSGYSASVGGGVVNTNKGEVGTIGGGSLNYTEGRAATIGGGTENTCNGDLATIAGGQANIAGPIATVGGGNINHCTGTEATIAGGAANHASGLAATVGGGDSNTSSGDYSVVPGGGENVASGTYSFAAGRRAQANNDGCFIWADSQDVDYGTTGPNQFKIRASGGFRVDGSAHFTGDVFVDGKVYAVVLPPSDRNVKTNFGAVDSRDVLKRLASIPVQTWNYKADVNTRHIGPMAQDFYAAFKVGPDDKHIATVDADGVALAAIQGLHEIVKEKDAEIQSLKKSVAELQAQQAEFDSLSKRIVALEKLSTTRAEGTRSEP